MHGCRFESCCGTNTINDTSMNTVNMDVMEKESRAFLLERERDVLWLLVNFGERVTTPLLEEISALNEKLKAQKEIESAMILTMCELEERKMELELENAALKEHAQNGKSWLDAWREAEGRAEVFKRFYEAPVTTFGEIHETHEKV